MINGSVNPEEICYVLSVKKFLHSLVRTNFKVDRSENRKINANIMANINEY